MSTETISWGYEYVSMSNIMSHIIMAIISHEHTDTLKFILSDLNLFHNVHINSIYYAALCSENIPIIKHLQQTFDDSIDIFMIEGLILNKKYDLIQLLFSDEKKIKDNNIIGSVIEYAFDFNNKYVLDIIVQLASIYMPDYTEYENEQLALSAFIQRNINASELIRLIYEKNYLSATENKEVSTDILDYLVDMNIKAVDVSKIIRLCAQLKQRTLNPKILSAIKSTAGGCYSK